MESKTIGAICTMLCSTFGSAIADDLDSGFIDSFKSFNSNAWALAEYEFSHPHFDTDWRKENAIFGANEDLFGTGITLRIKPHSDKSPVGNKFSGASVRRTTRTHYGRYESWIRPAVGAGFVTGFFTYTGPHYGTQHDEIDIEFLGGNTREIHIAWFENGGLKNKFIELSFDAAEKPRLYAFEWLQDRINWFVENKLIFTINQKESPLPKNTFDVVCKCLGRRSFNRRLVGENTTKSIRRCLV